MNVLGRELADCSHDPLTGFFRDGCCNTNEQDQGVHTVCAQMTDSFLEFSKAMGNDLSTPVPQYGFEGLKAGDQWCLCAARFKQAYDAGVAPNVVLAATHIRTLEIVPFAALVEHAVDKFDQQLLGLA